jgi:hypothetical protein
MDFTQIRIICDAVRQGEHVLEQRKPPIVSAYPEYPGSDLSCAIHTHSLPFINFRSAWNTTDKDGLTYVFLIR